MGVIVQNMKANITGYRYGDNKLNASHDYLLPTVKAILAKQSSLCKRIFEVGCGNGSVANALSKLDFEVTGVDASEEGIAQAHQSYPDLNIHLGSAYDELRNHYGQFPIVISLEVVEHLYFPRKFAKTIYDLLEAGGTAIISTPYHGYWKNLAMALTGTMDAHFTVLWDHGHIKFWSLQTLQVLLREAGFVNIEFYRVGRLPVLAKSMIAIAKKPSQ
jgi:2-polyprenyl-6-hydroxyphenyl methylase/3-demethylubiquinone-9 3-methyltransferase